MISPEKFSCDQIVVNGNVFRVSGKTPVKAASSGTVNRSESPMPDMPDPAVSVSSRSYC